MSGESPHGTGIVVAGERRTDCTDGQLGHVRERESKLVVHRLEGSERPERPAEEERVEEDDRDRQDRGEARDDRGLARMVGVGEVGRCGRGRVLMDI